MRYSFIVRCLLLASRDARPKAPLPLKNIGGTRFPDGPEIFQALFDMRAVQQFQAEVLEVIGSVSTEARGEIIRRLTERDALRSALDLNWPEVLPG